MELILIQGENSNCSIFNNCQDNFRHPAAIAHGEVKEDTTKEAKQDGLKKSDVNHVMQKILKQQKHLLSHLVKLDSTCGGPLLLGQELINSDGRHQKGKGYILQTFLNNVADSIEGVNSHDSGIGSAIPGNVGSSTNNFTDENDFQSRCSVLS